ncbi:MAG: HAMP domain-containing protein [Calditrichaeota bacterium]|nr:MAG: HAMP domain-containing protein [Calditrichota bacterium]
MSYKHSILNLFRSSLQRRFFLYFLTMVILIVFFVSAAVYFFQTRMLLNEAQEKAFRLTRILAYTSLNAILTEDYVTIQLLIDSMNDGKDILAVTILDTNGVVIASNLPENRGRKLTDLLTLQALETDHLIQQKSIEPGEEDIWDTAVPIFILDKRIATARIKYSVADTYKGLLSTIAGIGGIAIILAAGLSYHISRTISKPIAQVVELADEYGKGNLNASVDIQREDEIGHLVETLNKLSERLKSLIEEKIANENLIVIGEFGSYIIHDLKNPLSGIHLLADGLHRRLPEDSPLKKYSTEILLASQRLEDFTRRTLDIARSARLNKSSVNINELIRNAVSEIQYRAEDIQIEEDSQLPEILADYQLLYMAFKNLLTNAVEATTNHDRITISSGISEESVFIKVKDSGQGIPNDRLTTIFRPFFSMKDGGHGLGLAMVKK